MIFLRLIKIYLIFTLISSSEIYNLYSYIAPFHPTFCTIIVIPITFIYYIYMHIHFYICQTQYIDKTISLYDLISFKTSKRRAGLYSVCYVNRLIYYFWLSSFVLGDSRYHMVSFQRIIFITPRELCFHPQQKNTH